MFSQASVILSMGGGCAWQRGHAWRGACMGVFMEGVYAAGGHAWQGGGGVHMQGGFVAGEMATAADGWHPTGMHPCS